MRLIFLGTQFYYMLWFHSNDIFGEERGRKPHSSGVNADYFPKPVLRAKDLPQALSPLVRKTPSLTSLLLLHHPQGLAPQSPFGAVPQEKGTCETRLLCCTSLAGEAFPILTASRLSWMKLIKLLTAPAWQTRPARDRGLGGERDARRAATGRAGGAGGSSARSRRARIQRSVESQTPTHFTFRVLANLFSGRDLRPAGTYMGAACKYRGRAGPAPPKLGDLGAVVYGKRTTAGVLKLVSLKNWR